ncbi:MAG: trypsin-like peptidase domain-containing protein [bacterium]
MNEEKDKDEETAELKSNVEEIKEKKKIIENKPIDNTSIYKEREKENKFMRSLVIYFTIFFLGALLMYGLIFRFPSVFNTVITREESSVTITDTGIADAVEKVYDSVVIVSSYVSGKLSSTGSGFVYSIDGDTAYILTNHHVIDDATTVNVRFTDGTIAETTIVGSDEYEDVAVLSVSAESVTLVADMGDSEIMRVGDTTFAVGGPLDSEFSWTVTRGILSGKNRMVEVTLSDSTLGDYYMNVHQTDTAINSGNSGGPLCNSNGEVIGINTLKLMDTGVEGIGFAIPIEQALEVANDILQNGVRENPYLGIAMIDMAIAYSPLYPEYSEYQDSIEKNELSGGIIITEVVKDSSAFFAGFQVGDIIYSFNEKLIDSSARLRYELYNCKIGDTVNVLIVRDGEKQTIELELLE